MNDCVQVNEFVCVYVTCTYIPREDCQLCEKESK